MKSTPEAEPRGFYLSRRKGIAFPLIGRLSRKKEAAEAARKPLRRHNDG